MNLRCSTVIASVGTVALLLAGCSEDPKDEPGASPKAPAQAPAPVELALDIGDTPAKIGVLLAIDGTPPGQGQDVVPGAQGAQVAAYRLSLDDGTAPELVVELDDGTVEGAKSAMAALVDAGVSGVVVGSTGDHLLGAVDKAAAADVAVLLPYWRPSADVPDGVWVTGPSSGAVDERLQDALRDEELTQPMVITADGVSADGVGFAESAIFRGNNPARLVRRIDRAVETNRVDSVVIAASAPTQARLTSLLQGTQPDLPLLLTPEALSPTFASALLEGGGTTSGRLTTVGTDAADAATLVQSPQADSTASFFAALRLAAGDPAITDLLGERPMSEVASGADTMSHDAVIALTVAVAKAGSTFPADVRDALAGLKVDSTDGLAGPALDFSANPTLPSESVVVLRATTQDPGVRPAPTQLYWFAAAAKPAEAG